METLSGVVLSSGACLRQPWVEHFHSALGVTPCAVVVLSVWSPGLVISARFIGKCVGDNGEGVVTGQ